MADIPESTSTTPAGQEVERLRKLSFHASEGPWEVDSEWNEDGEYGAGPNPGRGYDDFLILDKEGRSLFGSENSAAKLIEEEYDEDGGTAWDQVAKRNAEFVVAAVNFVRAMLATPSVATPADDAGVRAPYLSDRFEWAAPGDQQEDAWLVRFCDQDVRDALYTGPDAEAEAWAAWERHAPGYNMYLFRLARLAASPKAPSVAIGAGEVERLAVAKAIASKTYANCAVTSKGSNLYDCGEWDEFGCDAQATYLAAADAAIAALAPASASIPADVERDRFANDEAAKALYDTWDDQPGWVPWVERGNSLMQERARREVML